MTKEELLKVAQGDINFTFQSIAYSLALIILSASLFVFELSSKVQMGILLCIIALFSSFIFYQLNTRLNAVLTLIELGNKQS
ncbi:MULTISPECIES: hypothetical protein [Pseudoalteromonas]|jgi:hypothetical protein|uniref:hypothetical protein n=1 Tax=Pseudoalteromonas TaxID=53246 RepID=UPI0002CBC9EE|nr:MULTISPECIES: hypothetical protein [Pseudoalteromonas]MCP4059062.1 hypothetical protein [Pseudoalteromonas sp.]ENN99571.1 hypothetical protein J139_06927 [Pseudoalteromonas agarivorans S816]MDC9566055.1 hypothetical protein [Pseudoalteromonas sp. GAB2316C]MDC9570379.1 hypothetical protein [Pseudoalteromonas sp. GABNB9D]MDC9574532.1 hypothetical protein [Pseudoalteromonas sp. GABNS16A]|tara:strand:- start:98 stop:343 length:246 start_codon:yes stop_codon:yes gene_type:complete